MADLQTGKMTTPLTLVEEEIFFQAAISLPIGGQTKMHSSDQETEKASVAKEPGKAYFEKKRSHRELEGEAKGSRVNPCGRKRD